MIRYIPFFLFCFVPSVVFAGQLGPLAHVVANAAERGEKSKVIQPWHEDEFGLKLIARFEGDPAFLIQNGADIIAQIGRVFVLRAPPTLLRSLSRTPGLIDMELSSLLEPTLELSTVSIGIPPLREGFLADGTGAIVGIIDTGLDVFHPDFRGESGQTRVLYFLDVTTPPEESQAEPIFDEDGTLVSGFGGSVYDNVQIDRILLEEAFDILPRDQNGHGTHVTGIATSNGLATDLGLPAGRYVGVAPGADIIMADADRNFGFASADTIAALAFMVERAETLQRPIVINLSIGSQNGPHDGTEVLEEVFQELAGPGKEGVAIVSSAGNDGARDIHAGGFLQKEAIIEVNVPPHTFRGGNGRIFFELWTDEPSKISISVESPNGNATRFIRQGKALDTTLEESQVIISNAPEGPTETGSLGAVIRIVEPSDKPIIKGRWKIRLRGEAKRFDLWLTNTNLGATRLATFLDPDRRISSPGTGEGTISVASFRTRSSWILPNGEEVNVGRTLGGISSFSSFGPNRLGLLKPDIAAPGEFILSALSKDAPPTLDSSSFSSLRIGDDGLHGAIQGTSMAAPHVAGAIAILLAIDPSLDLEEIRTLLWTTARCDQDTTCTLPNARWGFGKLDINAAVRVLEGEPPGVLSLERSSVGVSSDLIPPDGSFPATVYIVPRDEFGIPLGPGLQVNAEAEFFASGTEDSLGVETLSISDLGNGMYTATLLGQEPSSKRISPVEAIVVASVNGTVLFPRPKVAFAFDRRDIGLVGGACSISAQRAPSSGIILLFVFGCFAIHRQKRTGRYLTK